MTSRILVGGVATGRPGTYSESYVQATAGQGKFARGAVAIVGLMRGLAAGEVHEFASPAKLKQSMPDCEMRRMAELAFSPTTDPKITGVGAARVLLVAANPLTQATRTFLAAGGASGLTLKAQRWGAEGNRTWVKIAAATTHPTGIKLTEGKDGTSHVHDDLGGNANFDLEYTGGDANLTAATVDIVRGSAGYVDVKYELTRTNPHADYTPDGTKLAFGGTLTFTTAPLGGDRTVAVVGTKLSDGTAASENVVLPAAGGATATVNEYGSVTSIGLAAVTDAVPVVITGSAAKVLYSEQPTIQNIYDALYGVLSAHGYTITTDLPDRLTYRGETMDTRTAVDIDGVSVDFYSLLSRIVAYVNANCGFVVGSEFGTAGGAPAATGADPLYLASGADNDATADASAYETALALTKYTDVTALCVQSSVSSVHAKVVTHVTERNDHNERYAFLGAPADQTLAQLQTQVRALNSPFIRYTLQDPTVSGETTSEGAPYMLAAMAAGMFAGRPIGRPLTWKTVRVDDVSQNSGIDPEDDADALLDAGLLFLTKNRTGLFRWEKDVTTYLDSSYPQYQSGSAFESVVESKRDLRDALETVIGDEGWSGTAGTIEAIAAERLRRQSAKNDPLFRINAWRSLSVELVSGVYIVSYECYPLEGVDFILVRQSVTSWT